MTPLKQHTTRDDILRAHQICTHIGRTQSFNKEQVGNLTQIIVSYDTGIKLPIEFNLAEFERIQSELENILQWL